MRFLWGVGLVVLFVALSACRGVSEESLQALVRYEVARDVRATLTDERIKAMARDEVTDQVAAALTSEKFRALIQFEVTRHLEREREISGDEPAAGARRRQAGTGGQSLPPSYREPLRER